MELFDWSIIVNVIIGIWMAISIFSLPATVISTVKERDTITVGALIFFPIIISIFAPFLLLETLEEL